MRTREAGPSGRSKHGWIVIGMMMVIEPQPVIRGAGVKMQVLKISLPIIQPREWATDTQYISICKISTSGPSQDTRDRNATLKLYAGTFAR